MREEYIPTNDGKIYCQVSGEGYPLLLLHGNDEGHHLFSKQIDYFKDHFTVYAMDSRGQGKSELGEGKLTFDRIEQDILELFSYFNLQQVNIIGHSDGGNIGLYFASHHPEKVNKLIAMGANYETDALFGSVQRDLDALQERLAAVEDESSEHMRKKAVHNLMYDELALNEQHLQAIRVPVLILVGENDVIKMEHTEKLTNHIPNAKLHVVPNGSHSFFAELPMTLEPLAMDFFTQNKI